jgi:2-C-methyl-D-erythritol 4-phosphate cytidylyltransferase
VFSYSLLAIDGTEAFRDFVIVVRDARQRKSVEKYVGKFDLHSSVGYVFGGDSRQNSVLNALLYLRQRRPKFVLIHDAARPLITKDNLRQLLCAVDGHDAAVIAHRATDTLLSVAGRRRKYLLRDALWHIETPQIFKYDTILDAHGKATGPLTDDSSALCANAKVKIVENLHPNIKITHAEDILIARAILGGRLVK